MRIPHAALKSSQNTHLVTANNSPMQNLGTIDLSLNFHGLVIVHTFTVLRGLTFKIICGIDFLSDTNAVLDFSMNTLSLYDNLVITSLTTNIDRTSLVVLTRAVVIPPQCEMLAQVRVHERFKAVTSIVEMLPSLKNRLVAVAAAAVLPPGVLTACRLINIGHKAQRLRAGKAIATIERLNMEDPCNQPLSCVNDTIEQPMACASIEAVVLPPHVDRIKELGVIGLHFEQTKLDESQFEQLSALLYRYKDLFVSDVSKLPCSNLPPHKIEMISETPIRQRQFRQTPLMEKEMQRQCDSMQASGIIEDSTSPFNSPAFLIRKADGTFRHIVDLRGLNKMIKPLFYPLQSLEGVMGDIAMERPKWFSVLDLKCGFLQVPLHEDSKKLTAFSTATQHKHFNRLVAGLRSAPVVFMSSLSKLLHSELAHRAALYMDDSLIYTATFEDHLTMLGRFFAKFESAVLRLGPAKCFFALEELTYLGFDLSRDGVSIAKTRFAALESYPQPRNVKQCRQLLGLFCYFRKWIRNFSAITAPIRALLLKTDDAFKWLPVHTAALDALKAAVMTKTTLAYADMSKPFIIYVDASAQALGYALAQETPEGSLKYVAFGGRATRKYEKHLSACMLELTGLCAALAEYNPYISNGLKFIVRSDHMSLKWLKDLKNGPSSKLIRYALLLQQYDFELQHISGTANGLCDSLSRREYPTTEADENEPPVLGIHPHEYLNAVATALPETSAILEPGIPPAVNSIITADEMAHTEVIGHTQPEEASVSEADSALADAVDYLNVLDVERLDYTRQMRRRRKTQTIKVSPITEHLPIAATETSSPNSSRHAHSSPSTTTAQPGGMDNNDPHQDTALIADDIRHAEGEVFRTITPRVTLEAQRDDEFFSSMIDYLQTGQLPDDRQKARQILFQEADYYIADDKLWHLALVRNKRLQSIQPRYIQLCAPKAERVNLLQQYHDFIGHIGVVRCMLTLKMKYYWRSLSTDISLYISSCETCARIKSGPKPRYGITSMPVRSLHESLVIDHHDMSRLKGCKHPYKYILVLCDSFSQEILLEPCKTTSAIETAEIIYKRWICNFGIFKYLTSDRHKGFLAEVVTTLTKLSPGGVHLKCTPHRPCTTGLVELKNKKLLTFLRTVDQLDWPDYLSTIELANRSSICLATGQTPYYLSHGQDIRLQVDYTMLDTPSVELTPRHALAHFGERLQFMRDAIKATTADTHAATEKRFNKNITVPKFVEGDKVFLLSENSVKGLSTKHSPVYSGPWIIIEARPPLARLQNLYTARLMPSYIHMSKLRKLADENRDILYNRMRPATRSSTRQSASNTVVNTPGITPISAVTSYRPVHAMNDVTALKARDIAVDPTFSDTASSLWWDASDACVVDAEHETEVKTIDDQHVLSPHAPIFRPACRCDVMCHCCMTAHSSAEATTNNIIYTPGIAQQSNRRPFDRWCYTSSGATSGQRYNQYVGRVQHRSFYERNLAVNTH